MTELRERSAEVADRSREFDAATAGLTEGIESFLRLSSEVVANIGEISGGIGYIGESVRGIAGASEGVAAAGERLETEIGRFKA
jgi:methyl-accepting chemotaxis protein